MLKYKIEKISVSNFWGVDGSGGGGGKTGIKYFIPQ
jgi:hypothetical protein